MTVTEIVLIGVGIFVSLWTVAINIKLYTEIMKEKAQRNR